MRIGFRVQLAVVVAALISLSFVPAALATAPPATGFTGLCGAMGTTHPATVKHVMFILFENKTYGDVVGSSTAPYLSTTLIPGCGLATN